MCVCLNLTTTELVCSTLTMFDNDNVWTILHYKYKYKHNEYKYKYNTIHIYSYSYIRSDSYFEAGSKFSRVFFPNFPKFMYFSEFLIFSKFSIFCTIIFTNFLEYFSEWSARIFFRIYQSFFSQILEEYFSEFWVFILIFRSIFSQIPFGPHDTTEWPQNRVAKRANRANQLVLIFSGRC